MSDFIAVKEYNKAIASAQKISELKTEMTESQLGFLCGIIKDRRPSKILEVGVAAGGTTLVIMQCAKELGLEISLYSADLNKNYYSDPTKETGYIAKIAEFSEDYALVNHKYLLGSYLPEVLPDIGSGIDLLILDTVHHLPGELLDFLAALPFLSEKAIVVLHDVALQHEKSTDKYCYATQVLLSCAKGLKYLNNSIEYPNIAAFQVDKSTVDNIDDVFSALTLTWNYKPSDSEIGIYKAWYQKHFGESSCRLFEQAVEMNERTLSTVEEGFDDYMLTLCDSVLDRYESVYLYGAGNRGHIFHKALCDFWDNDKADECKYIVSDGKRGINNKCVVWGELDLSENALIVLTADSKEIKETLKKSKAHWIDVPKQIWVDLERKYRE